MRRPPSGPRLTLAVAAALAGAAPACVLPTYDESPPPDPPDPPPAAWSRSVGGLNDDQALAVATDRSGNVFVGGVFASYLSFDDDQSYLQPQGTSADAFVASYDPAGRPRWSISFGDPMSGEAVVGIATTSDGDAVIMGSFQGTFTLGRELTSTAAPAVFVARLDGATGAVAWSTALVDVMFPYGATPGGVAVDADDNVLVCGSYAGVLRLAGGTPLGTNTSTYNAFVLKLDPGGYVRWFRDIDDTGGARALAVTTDSDREVLVTGSHDGSAFLDGVNPTQDGSLAGQMFVAKYGPGNEFRWGQSFAALADTNLRGTAIAVDAEDSVLVAGDTTGELPFTGEPRLPADARDAFALKLGPAGNYLWHDLLDAKALFAEDTMKAIRAGADGTVFMAGNSVYSYDDGNGMMVEDNDLFLATLDGATGERVALELHDGDEKQIVGGLDISPGGALVLAGAFSGALDFGEGPLPEYGPLDIFVAQRLLP